MGVDISSWAEFKKDGKWKQCGDIFPLSDFDKKYSKKEFGEEPFPYRTYGLFGFLANIRNYSYCPVIHEPKGFPKDSEYLNEIVDEGYGYSNITSTYTREKDLLDGSGWSASWLSLKELLDYDYDIEFEDRRVLVQTGPNSWSGKEDSGEGNGIKTTMKDFLGDYYFKHLEILKQQGEPEDVRVVFYFS